MPGLPLPVGTPPAAVMASLNYLDPNLPEKPFTNLAGSETNIESWPVETLIRDARSLAGWTSEFQIDKSGFQYVEHESRFLNELETEEGMKAYMEEAEALLLSTLAGAKRVKVFNSTIRRKAHNIPTKPAARTPSNTGPVTRAHVDNTPASGARRVLTEMGEEGEELVKRRCQIINIWRPLDNPAIDCPLAVMDYRSLAWKDLKATDLNLSNEGGRKGENFSLVHNPSQKWWFLSAQQPNEPVIFKIYDSIVQDGISRLTPHTAFIQRDAPADAPSRQSVELRALVFY